MLRRLSADVLERPKLAPEVELVGQMQDTAFAEDQWLICYADSHYIQATRFLYHVLSHADGVTTVDEIARRVTAETGDDVSADDVRWLVKNRLAGSGLIDWPEEVVPESCLSADKDEPTPGGSNTNGSGQQTVVGPPDPGILGIRYRVPLLSYRLTAPVTAVLQHLFWLPLVVAVVIVAALINAWVFLTADLASGLTAVLFQPELSLLLIGINLLTFMFHEFGHAAALRRAGSRHGAIGFALYIIWPVFYTDVTHAYRLNRAQRIRVDLGGMYFQLIAIIGVFAAYQLTGEAVLLVVIVMTAFTFLQQFTPFLRFDGYYTIADIMGVHEPLALVKPFLRDHIPWPRDRVKSLPPMQPFARIAFVAYLLAIVLFLMYPILLGSFFGKEVLTQLPRSGQLLWDQFVAAWQGYQLIPQLVSTFQLVMWVLIPLGLGLFILMLLRLFSMTLLGLVRALTRRWRWGSSPGGSGPDSRSRTRRPLPFGISTLLPAALIGGAFVVLGSTLGPDPVAQGPDDQVIASGVPEATPSPAVETTPTPAESGIAAAPVETPANDVTPSSTAEPAPSPSPRPSPSATAEVETTPAPVSPSTTAILDQITAAEETLRTGEFEVLAVYDNGNRALTKVQFIVGDTVSVQRLHTITTYEGTTNTPAAETIVVGDRSWKRQADGAWTEGPSQASVAGQVQVLLPHANTIENAELSLEQDLLVLGWRDARNEADAVMKIDAATGIPQELHLSRDTIGTEVTITYLGWNTRVTIQPPAG